ncbi:MAG: hypothetical protein ACOCYX_04120 [Spirochaetota bacterium]
MTSDASARTTSRESSIARSSCNAQSRVASGEPEPKVVPIVGEVVVDHATASVPVALDEAGMQQLAGTMPSLVGDDGHASVFGTSLTFSTSEFQAMQTGSRTRVTVRVAGKSTIISATDDMRNLAGGIIGGVTGGLGLGVGLGVGFGVGIGALGSALFATIFPVAILGLSFLGSRWLYRAIARNRRSRNRERVNRIASFVAQGRGGDGTTT